MQTRARRSSSPRTSTRTRSFDLKASDTMRHASGVMVPAGFVTRITTEPIRCRASRSSGSSCRFVLQKRQEDPELLEEIGRAQSEHQSHHDRVLRLPHVKVNWPGESRNLRGALRGGDLR